MKKNFSKRSYPVSPSCWRWSALPAPVKKSGVFTFQPSRLCWDALFLNQLLVCLVQADHRARRIVRTLIYIQNILHPRYKLRPWFWDAPFLLLPRLKFIFFRGSITAVSEILSTTPRHTCSSAISRSVHRSRPSGASEQAMATI